MTLEEKPQSNGGTLPSLVECPAEGCGADLTDTKPCIHIAQEHGGNPEDFGLSPMGEHE